LRPMITNKHDSVPALTFLLLLEGALLTLSRVRGPPACGVPSAAMRTPAACSHQSGGVRIRRREHAPKSAVAAGGGRRAAAVHADRTRDVVRFNSAGRCL